MEQVILNRIQASLDSGSFSISAKKKMMNVIENDLILPKLKLTGKSDIYVEKQDDESWSIQIGPRDFHFSKGGKWFGSGTMMRDVKWK